MQTQLRVRSHNKTIDDRCDADDRQEELNASIMVGREAAPALAAGEAELDFVALLVEFGVVYDWHRMHLPG